MDALLLRGRQTDRQLLMTPDRQIDLVHVRGAQNMAIQQGDDEPISVAELEKVSLLKGATGKQVLVLMMAWLWLPVDFSSPGQMHANVVG